MPLGIHSATTQSDAKRHREPEGRTLTVRGIPRLP